jgi:hypothetical protein
MARGVEVDPAVDDERAAGGRTAPHGRAVPARVPGIDDVRAEEARGPCHGQEKERRRLGTGRRLDDVDPAVPPEELGQGRPAPSHEPDVVSAARERLQNESRLSLAAAEVGTEVEGEQPHAGEDSPARFHAC